MRKTPGTLALLLTRNYIGRSQFTPGPLLKGRVDDLRSYSVGLSQAEIELLASKPPATAGR